MGALLLAERFAWNTTLVCARFPGAQCNRRETHCDSYENNRVKLEITMHHVEIRFTAYWHRDTEALGGSRLPR